MLSPWPCWSAVDARDIADSPGTSGTINQKTKTNLCSLVHVDHQINTESQQHQHLVIYDSALMNASGSPVSRFSDCPSLHRYHRDMKHSEVIANLKCKSGSPSTSCTLSKTLKLTEYDRVIFPWLNDTLVQETAPYLAVSYFWFRFGHTRLVSYNIMLLCQRASIPFPPFLVAKFDNTQPPSKEASPGQKALVSKSGKSFVLTGHLLLGGLQLVVLGLACWSKSRNILQSRNFQQSLC